MVRIIFVAGIAASLCGCASQLGTMFNRPVVEDSVSKMPGVLSLSADRRTVVFIEAEDTVPPSSFRTRAKFCAEPPPDTANGIKAALDGKIDVTGKGEVKANASLDDEFTTTVTILADRTAALDAYRTGVYALCQYHLNGAVKSEDVKELFTLLTETFLKAQEAQQIQTTTASTETKKAQLARAELTVKNNEAQAKALMQTRQQEQSHQVALEQAKATQIIATPAK